MPPKVGLRKINGKIKAPQFGINRYEIETWYKNSIEPKDIDKITIFGDDGKGLVLFQRHLWDETTLWTSATALAPNNTIFSSTKLRLLDMIDNIYDWEDEE